MRRRLITATLTRGKRLPTILRLWRNEKRNLISAERARYAAVTRIRAAFLERGLGRMMMWINVKECQPEGWSYRTEGAVVCVL
jgi:hypothetical protein